MNKKQLELMTNKPGFIAALDQSGGSTPRALLVYGVKEDEYNSEDEMFLKVHEMRTRIIKSKSFNSDKILGAILFENTMDRKIDGKLTADFLWEEKGVVPFLKIDKGLADLDGGVQMMKPMPELESLLEKAVKRNIFGTKMRSVIKEATPHGIEEIVKQQFDVAKIVAKHGLVPIIEPEVDINIKDKAEAEEILVKSLEKHLNLLDKDTLVMFKLTLPTKENLYKHLLDDERVIRIVALSGGYSREKSNELLALNEGIIASFSRALTEGLNVNQTDDEFDNLLGQTISDVFEASIK